MNTTTRKTQTEAERFFYQHAGYSYNPVTQTREQGRKECARELAAAEEWARLNLSFEWNVDDVDSSEFSDERPAWALWCCLARGSDDKTVASLSGIDFGRGGEPWGDSYKRVVEAELALEAMP